MFFLFVYLFIDLPILYLKHWSEADEQYHADLLVPVLLVYGKGDQFVSYEDEVWMNEVSFFHLHKIYIFFCSYFVCRSIDKSMIKCLANSHLLL